MEIQATFGENPECRALDNVKLMVDRYLSYRPFLVRRVVHVLLLELDILEIVADLKLTARSAE